MTLSHSNLWRNFGILCAWYVFFVAMTVFFTSRWKQMGEGGRGLLIPREKQKKVSKAVIADEESQAVEKPSENSGSDSEKSDATIDNQLVNNTSVFTWKNLTYTVKTPHGDRVLLDNVQGFVKPGTLGALMGSSGVSALAMRLTDGYIY
jgi:ABC-type glutathione transport system ATPase component